MQLQSQSQILTTVKFTPDAGTSCLVTCNFPINVPNSSNLLVVKISKTGEHSTSTSTPAAYVSITPLPFPTNKFQSGPEIYMNGTFGKSIGLEHGELVTIQPVESTVPTVTRAFVIPFSKDDWEILEPNSSKVTDSLLNQIRVIYNGLTFPFWISKSIVVILKVESFEPNSECGILDNSSKIIVAPAANNTVMNSQLLNSSQKFQSFRIHIPQFQEENFNKLSPNFRLLFENVNHGFIYNDNEPKSFVAKVFSPNIENDAEPLNLKIFNLKSLEIDPDLLKECLPKVPWPCLYVHDLLTHEKLQLKSWITLMKIHTSADSLEEIEHKSITISTSISGTGNTSVFESLVDPCVTFVKSSLSISGINYRHLLLNGKEGSGKTTIVQRIAEKFQTFPYYVHVERIPLVSWIGKKPETVENLFKTIIIKCAKVSPFILILDDLDALVSPIRTTEEDVQQKFLRQRFVDVIIDSLNQICPKDSIKYCIIATSTCSIDLRLFGNYFFCKIVSIPPPTAIERLNIFYTHLGQSTSSNTNTDEIKKQLLSLHDENSTPLILATMAKAWNANYKNQSFEEVKNTTLKRIEEIEMNSNTPDTSIRWDQIGGLGEIKDSLIQLIQSPLKYPKLYEQVPFNLPSSILLYGYPGTGKTMLALGLRDLVPNLKFIHIKGPQLLSKYIGSSEENVKLVFERARNSRPCILFFDEFESLVPRRGHDSTGVTDRVVNQFLTEMDGVAGGLGPGVYLVGATSRPDLIDPAILRSGRMEKHLFVPMPRKDERMEILEKLMEKLDIDQSDRAGLSLAQIAEMTENYTGADLESIINSALLIALQESLRAQGYNETLELEICKEKHNAFLNSIGPNTEDNDVPKGFAAQIAMANILSILNDYKPSIHGREFQRFNKIFADFKKSRMLNMENETVGTRTTLA